MSVATVDGVDASADVAALRARIRQLEVEHSLMQRELDSVSEAAQRNESQIRCGYFRPVLGFGCTACPKLSCSDILYIAGANRAGGGRVLMGTVQSCVTPACSLSPTSLGCPILYFFCLSLPPRFVIFLPLSLAVVCNKHFHVHARWQCR